MVRILCLIIGYLFGMFQTAYFYGKKHGIDIREQGSGNAGMTNALRVLGRKAGITVLLCDMFKTVIPIVIVRILFGEIYADKIYLLVLYTAAGAILGHNYPWYLQFRGGKGIAATAGLILAFHPYFIIVGLVVFLTTLFTTHFVSLGSLLVYVCFVIQLIVCGQNGLFAPMDQMHLYELYIVGILLAALAFWKHSANIDRLLKGTENKTFLKKKKGEI
ncbi:MAG: glycerol-3-phosphate 1-O-acyltransferase PlsY [Lachnospiraceae bacterium]